MVLNEVQEVDRKEKLSSVFKNKIKSKEICSVYVAFGSERTNLFGGDAFSGK